MRFLRAGTPMAVPASFMSDLMSQPGATGGKQAYDQTWTGQLDEMKKSVGNMLAVLETPLGNALSAASVKLDGWASSTEARFKSMGGAIGQEWSSGNIGGLSHTLADIVGDPKLAGGIDIAVSSMRSLGQIVENSVIPAGKDLLAVATPALKGFSDVLELMADHRSTTEALIFTLGGLKVLSTVAKWGDDATRAVKAFNEIMEGRGIMSALAAYARGLSGLSAAQKEVAATAGAEAGAEDAASGSMGGGAGPGRLAGAGKYLGAAGLAGAGGMMTYQGMSSKMSVGSGLETIGGDAAMGAVAGSVLPGLGTLAGAGIGAGVGGITDLVRMGAVGSAVGGIEGLFGGGTHHHNTTSSAATTIRQINITVPGAGNPTKVANAIPKALNAQIAAAQQMAQRRGGS
jgi:hypothetical protein